MCVPESGGELAFSLVLPGGEREVVTENDYSVVSPNCMQLFLSSLVFIQIHYLKLGNGGVIYLTAIFSGIVCRPLFVCVCVCVCVCTC